MNLADIRKKIDKLDTQLLATIADRYKLVKEVVLWKEKNGVEIYDEQREKKIIKEHKSKSDQYNISAETIEDIFRSLFAESHIQEKQFLQNDETSPRKIRRKSIENHSSLLDIFQAISSSHQNFFFLESLGDDEWNQQSFLGFAPKKKFAAKGNEVFIDDISFGEVENPILWLEDQFKPYQNLIPNTREEGFVGGLIGHINFEAIQYTEPTLLLDSHPDFYDFEFGLFLDGLIYNRKTEALEYVFTDEDRSKMVFDLMNKSPENQKSLIGENEVSSFSEISLDTIIQECKTEIENGNVFQIVPSRRYEYDISGSEIEFYKELREINPSPNMFFINFESRKLIGSSPEMIAKTQGRRIETYPIAGTRSRGETPQEDAYLSAKMLMDEKEVAEHLMLVDMARNDLGRVCEYGSVKVEETMALKKYSHVQHLVSRVVGKMKPNISSLQAMFSNFPMGTVVGSPRIEAIKILKRLEKSPRGPYSGGVGYWSITGDMQMTLAIRSLFISGKKGFAQAGAGVVYDSVVQYEKEEIEKKSMNIRSILRKRV